MKNIQKPLLLNQCLYLEAILVRVEGCGFFAILHARLEPHEEIDIVVVNAVPEAEVVLDVDAFGLHGLAFCVIEANRVHKGTGLRGVVLTTYTQR